MFLDRLLRRKIMHNNTAKKVMLSEEEKSFYICKREINPECVNIKIIPFEENSKFEDHPDVTELPEIFQGIAWV